jgi:DNA-binding response OmpR family regulator
MAKRILIVDDEKDLVDILKARLEIEGYEVLTAYDGQEGLEKAQEEKPDLILLDIMMPKMNGYQVCRLLKFDDEYKRIPIVIITARGQEQDKSTGEEVGANEYITKPFENGVLLAKIKELIGE